MPDRVATGKQNTAKKARQRARIAASNPGVGELTIRKERADRLREFLQQDRRSWADVESAAPQHIADLVVQVQQFQSARQTIITLTVPSNYVSDALLLKQCGTVFLRAYILEDVDGMMDEAEAREQAEKAEDWATTEDPDVSAIERLING